MIWVGDYLVFCNFELFRCAIWKILTAGEWLQPSSHCTGKRCCQRRRVCWTVQTHRRRCWRLFRNRWTDSKWPAGRWTQSRRRMWTRCSSQIPVDRCENILFKINSNIYRGDSKVVKIEGHESWRNKTNIQIRTSRSGVTMNKIFQIVNEIFSK